ncbi:Trehalose transport system permease protein SugB [bioreactor metagenome]|jgi:multiple sugar transport system permease protein|uniref:Trehalose transport system permease protein SugB n=1 Tax=bioreactor metagenome TaxID=1076179 RepID=A0A644Y971_9ZZZZ
MWKKKKAGTAAAYVVLIFVAIFSVLPFYYVFSIATKTPAEAFSTTFSWIWKPTMDNFKQLFVEDNFLFYFKNSMIIAVLSMFVSVPLATLAAYGLIRHNSKLSNRLLNSMLALRIFPPMLLVIPFFLLATALKITDNKYVLMLIIVASNQPFAIWLMRGFIISLPKELDEAAHIDGCSLFKTFYKIILPLSMPGIGTASIFTFLLSYNEYLYALVLTGKKSMTLTVAMGKYAAEELVYWCMNAAGVVAIILPICIIMIFLQKWLVKGLTAGSVKE